MALLGAPATQLTHLPSRSCIGITPCVIASQATPVAQSPSPSATIPPYVCSIQQKHAKLPPFLPSRSLHRACRGRVMRILPTPRFSGVIVWGHVYSFVKLVLVLSCLGDRRRGVRSASRTISTRFLRRVRSDVDNCGNSSENYWKDISLILCFILF